MRESSSGRSCEALLCAIAAGDPSLCKPTEQPNTHWSNWLPDDSQLLLLARLAA
jgi:uncharacterized protein DUF7003